MAPPTPSPSVTPAPRSALVVLSRLARRWSRKAARALGIRRGLKVDGVYYKELSPESLSRALSKRGAGHKDFRVTFPDRSKLVVRCSRERVFADLMGPIGLDRLEPLLPVVRPGGRVLEFGAGTGYRAHWLSFVVGPSGGVVAITTDPTDNTYAQHRYPRGNIAFELAEGFGLAGETDGAFNAVVVLAVPADPVERRTLLAELWRLTAPGGAMFVGGGGGGGDPVTGAILEDLARSSKAELKAARSAEGRPHDALLLKPREGDEAESR